MPTLAVDHPFVTALRDAALGRFPDDDGRTEVAGALPGPCDAVAFFARHTIVAADIEPDWVRAQAAHQIGSDGEDPSTELVSFLTAMRQRLADPPTYASVVTVAHHRAAVLRGELVEVDEPEPGWGSYRRDVRSFRYRNAGTDGAIFLGRGPGDRMDVFVRLNNPGRGGGGPSRELLAAALTLIPRGEVLFGSAPIHDTRALRTMLAGGFTPICTEALFLTRSRTP